MKDYHQPVLLQEVIQFLDIKPDGIYIDATFGRGGHATEILHRLGQNGFLLAIDKDPDAVFYARENFKCFENFRIKQGSFNMLQTFANEFRLIGRVNGILLDLGVSSPQLDDPSRGFSFLQDGPLDMRMDPQAPLDAATWINRASMDEIVKVLQEYGEERYARRIAKAIVLESKKEPIIRTKRLADIVAKANPAWERYKHPATRTFQAIRIYINQELQDLKTCLDQCLSVLALGGRFAVISFHSLEDRLVKSFIQQQQRGGNIPRDLPLTQKQSSPNLKRVAWGVKASDAEIKNNPRSRSAILRVAEKLK